LYWLCVHWTKDFMAQFSPTKEKTVLICDNVCSQMRTEIKNLYPVGKCCYFQRSCLFKYLD
jgi:hypothetical protein